MKSKEQTPITAEGFYLNNRSDLLRSNLGTKEFTIDMMEQYAQAKVLEALERVQEITPFMIMPKTKEYQNGFKRACNQLKNLIETEVKPKYETSK